MRDNHNNTSLLTSSMKLSVTNRRTRADFPTPPPPSTTILCTLPKSLMFSLVFCFCFVFFGGFSEFWFRFFGAWGYLTGFEATEGRNIDKMVDDRTSDTSGTDTDFAPPGGGSWLKQDSLEFNRVLYDLELCLAPLGKRPGKLSVWKISQPQSERSFSKM